MAFDAEELKYMAAQAVGDYLNNGATLNEAVAKIAVDKQLNGEQLSRLVETTNKVAYLKVLENTTDRTVSFPLASVAEVNDAIIAPRSEGVEKVAHCSSVRSPLDIVSGIRTAPMEKVASEAGYEFKLSDQEIDANMLKVAGYFRKQFEDVAMAKEVLLADLVKAAAALREDPLAGAKIAVKSTMPEELCKLAGVEVGENSLGRPFYERELEKVAGLDSLWQEAKALTAREDQLNAQLEKFAGMGFSFLEAAKPLLKSAGVATTGVEPAKPLIGGLLGYLGRGKTLGQKVGAGITFADRLGTASLIDKGPSAWQSLRG